MTARASHSLPFSALNPPLPPLESIAHMVAFTKNSTRDSGSTSLVRDIEHGMLGVDLELFAAFQVRDFNHYVLAFLWVRTRALHLVPVVQLHPLWEPASIPRGRGIVAGAQQGGTRSDISDDLGVGGKRVRRVDASRERCNRATVGVARLSPDWRGSELRNYRFYVDLYIFLDILSPWD